MHSIGEKSLTYDEVAHITRGWSFWRLVDHRLIPNHMPLGPAWAVLPLLDEDLVFPSRDQDAWYLSKVFTIGRQFLNHSGNDTISMLRQTRSMMAVLSVLLGLAVFVWSYRLFGSLGGLISLGLYTLSPTILANARLVTTDMAASLFFFLAVWSMWWMLRRVSVASALLSALALAGLFCSKMSAGLIIPIGLGLLLIRLLVAGRLQTGRLSGKQVRLTTAGHLPVLVAIVLVYVCVVWGAIWGVFGFRYEAMLKAQPGRDHFFTPIPLRPGYDAWSYMARGLPRTAALVNWARTSRILPEGYLFGVLSTLHGAQRRDAFLDGERRSTGWRSFFPKTFLYKVPLPIMAMLLLGLIGLCCLRQRFETGTGQSGPIQQTSTMLGKLYATAPLWLFMLVYWGFAIQTSLNIGHRHLLPTFAPMFVLCGAAGSWWHVHKSMRLVLAGLLLLLCLSTARIHPHYLAYFNPIAGGPANGYRHLVDSSLDWGQDLPGLKRWLDTHRGTESVYVEYFGNGAPQTYGLSDIRYVRTPLRTHPLNPDFHMTYDALGPGIYCISATRLQQLYLRPVANHWTPRLEVWYRQLRREMQQFDRTAGDSPARIAAIRRQGFVSHYTTYMNLRFGRLSAYLRQRQPDAMVGYSILIYRLDQAALHQALDEPLPPTF